MTDSSGITTVLAIVNDAGSAGKSTSVVSMAASLAARGRTVLVVDLDPQANATFWLGVDPETVTRNAGDVLLRQVTFEDAVLPTNTAGVTLLPGSVALRQQRVELGKVPGGEQRLRKALKASSAEVVLIDCQAGAGEFFPFAAMVAATGVVTVTFPATKELEGIPRVEAMIQDVADAYERELPLSAIIPCNVPSINRGNLYRDAMTMLRDSYGDLVTPEVRQSVTAATAYAQCEPLLTHAPSAGVTQDYEAVVDYLIARGVL